MYISGMLISDVQKRRQDKARRLKECRELFGIAISDVQKRSGLSFETIYRIEGGVKAWSVDSELSYLTSINDLIDKKESDKPGLKLPPRPMLLIQLKHISKL